MMDDVWDIDVYRYYTNKDFARRRKVVDRLELDWLEVSELYHSPEVRFFNKDEILEQSGWTEEEVMLLFLDRRFPSTNFGRKEVVEVHALIQFFARKDAVLRIQKLRWEKVDELKRR